MQNRNFLFNQDNLDTSSQGDVSEVVSSRFIQALANIIDDRVNKRLLEEDIAKTYVGRITSMELSNKYEVFATQTTTSSGTTTMTNSYEPIASRITVEYNDNQTATISNHSVRALTSSDNGKYVKICTYDGVQYFFLHLM